MPNVCVPRNHEWPVEILLVLSCGLQVVEVETTSCMVVLARHNRAGLGSTSA